MKLKGKEKKVLSNIYKGNYNVISTQKEKSL